MKPRSWSLWIKTESLQQTSADSQGCPHGNATYLCHHSLDEGAVWLIQLMQDPSQTPQTGLWKRQKKHTKIKICMWLSIPFIMLLQKYAGILHLHRNNLPDNAKSVTICYQPIFHCSIRAVALCTDWFTKLKCTSHNKKQNHLFLSTINNTWNYSATVEKLACIFTFKPYIHYWFIIIFNTHTFSWNVHTSDFIMNRHSVSVCQTYILIKNVDI